MDSRGADRGWLLPRVAGALPVLSVLCWQGCMGTPAFEPQRVLAGRYRLKRRLEKGGMGTIWLAEHLILQAPVAVKLIDPDAVFDGETSARFLREAKAAAALRSAHVVQILDYGVDEGISFIVMELLEGESLAQRLRSVKRLAPVEAVRVITHIGRAIGRAHEAGIVHRDLKPENVFLVSNEDEEVAKVLDFGVAKIAHGELREGTRTRTGSILGTPYYMSPEQAQGNKTVDCRSDLWSLGVIAFECFTGERPFFSDGLGDLVLQICVRDLPVPSSRASVPAGFDGWFRRAVERDPERRFQSAREMTEALREVIGLQARSGSPDSEVLRAEKLDQDLGIQSISSASPTLALKPELVQRLAQSVAAGMERERRSGTHPGDASDPGMAPTAPQLPASGKWIDDSPPHRSVAAQLAVVAAVALVLGLAAGLGFWWRPHARTIEIWQRPPELKAAGSSKSPIREEQQSSRTRPAPLNSAPIEPPAQRASAAEGARADKRGSVQKARVEGEPADSTASGEAASPVDPASAEGVAPALVPTRDAVIPPSASSDTEWVKPAWAVPDEEPRKAPDLMQGEDPKE